MLSSSKHRAGPAPSFDKLRVTVTYKFKMSYNAFPGKTEIIESCIILVAGKTAGMAYYNTLQLNIYPPSMDTHNKITKLLGVTPVEADSDEPSCWAYELNDESNIDFINKFLDILAPNYGALARINVRREDISILHFYEYGDQCNMEFDPVRLNRLGDNGITLCISCWQK